jgi:phosphoribosylformimino-5-aminoimidazole carboxamide ribotide isomerase
MAERGRAYEVREGLGWVAGEVDRIIIGTAAVRDPALVKDAARKFPGRVAVGLDSRDGKVAVEGWARTSALAALDLARRFEDPGVAAIIHTDIGRDGLLQGHGGQRPADAARSLTGVASMPPETCSIEPFIDAS